MEYSPESIRSLVEKAFPHARTAIEPVLHVLENPDNFLNKWPLVVDAFLKVLEIYSNNDREWLVKEEDHIAVWKILKRYEQWHLWWERQPVPKRTYTSKFSWEEAHRLREEGLSLAEIAQRSGFQGRQFSRSSKLRRQMKHLKTKVPLKNEPRWPINKREKVSCEGTII